MGTSITPSRSRPQTMRWPRPRAVGRIAGNSSWSRTNASRRTRRSRSPASTEHHISAETGNEEHQHRRQDQLGAHAVGGMCLGIVEQSPGAHEAYGCHDDEPQSAEDESVAVVASERSAAVRASAASLRSTWNSRPLARKIELLDDEAKGNDGNAGSDPGEERALIGCVIAIARNHDALNIDRV